MSDNKMSLREQFESEITDKGVARLFKTHSTEYIKWLESKIKNLNLASVNNSVCLFKDCNNEKIPGKAICSHHFEKNDEAN